jgi:hypothetical protein
LRFGHADLLADRMRLGLRVEEVARVVARVQRLDQDRNVLLGRLPGIAKRSCA